MDCFVATLLAKTGAYGLLRRYASRKDGAYGLLRRYASRKDGGVWIASSLRFSQRRGRSVRSKKLSNLPPFRGKCLSACAKAKGVLSGMLVWEKYP